MNRTLDKRIAYFKEHVMKPYSELYKMFPEEIQYLPFVVELKAMQFAYGIEMMFRQILPNLPHGNDGLIFTCRNTDYKHGTDPHILKWKPESENSVDFRLSLDFPLVQPDAQDRAEGITDPYVDYDAMPIANLLVHAEGNRDDFYATMYLEPAEWEGLKSLNEPLDDRIAECYMDSQKRWRFMRWRDDKEKPNHISTVESVIESIVDRVTEQELIASAKRIRDEWKRRNAGSNAGAQPQGRGAPNGALKRKVEEPHGGARPSPGPGSS
jgi:mRNA guanylyltransferase